MQLTAAGRNVVLIIGKIILRWQCIASTTTVCVHNIYERLQVNMEKSKLFRHFQNAPRKGQKRVLITLKVIMANTEKPNLLYRPSNGMYMYLGTQC